MSAPRKRPDLDPEKMKRLKEQLKNIEARENRKMDWHWSLTFTIAGGLGGAIISTFIYQFTMMSYGMFALIVLVPGILAFLLQWKYFFSQEFIKKHFRMNILVYALYNLAGIGFTFSALFFMLNWAGSNSEKQVERHKILGIDRNYVVDSNYLTVILLENDAYQNDPFMRSVPYKDAMRRKSFPFLDIEYSDGLLGFKIYHGHHVSPDSDAKKVE